jgi:hypothetical protein
MPTKNQTTPKTGKKSKTVRTVDMYAYQKGTAHTAVVFGRAQEGAANLSNRSYRRYHTNYEPRPIRRISFSSLLRLRRALGHLFEQGKVEGYTWTCEYDETLNGHMRIKE